MRSSSTTIDSPFSASTIEQNKAVRKLLIEYLSVQAEKLQEHILIQEREEEDILTDNIEKLLIHIKLEEASLDGVAAFQKVIAPLEKIYFRDCPGSDQEILSLKKIIKKYSAEMLNKNEKIRNLLNRNAEKLKKEIRDLKTPRGFSSGLANNIPCLIDITA